MRKLWMSGILGLLLGAGVLPAGADQATVQALGNVSLVLEDETTTLSLFNLGNPAGAAFRPAQSRLDLTLQAGQKLASEEFTTSPVDIIESTPNITSYVFGNTIDAFGTTVTVAQSKLFFPNLDQHGNTLPAGTLFSHKRATFTAGFFPAENAWYQGIFTKPSEDLSLQFIPSVSYQSQQTTDQSGLDDAWQSGGSVRAAYQLLPNAALGAGFTGLALGARTDLQQETGLQTGVEAGAALRLAELFDAEDLFDVGVLLRGSRQTDEIAAASAAAFTQTSRPWLAEAQGVYSYKSLMDVALQLGYAAQEDYSGWSGQELLSSALRNLEYNLHFRVRLPMVRDDDLRFGVTFNNQGHGHPYPTGTLETLDPNTLALGPRLLTSSSSIGIGMALVPAEGSIVALEYRLSSSLSQFEQAEEALCDSGFTGFTLSGQYELLKGLSLRAHWSDQRLNFQSRPQELLKTVTTTTGGLTPGVTTTGTWIPASTLLTQITYTRSFGFGVGIEDGPIRVNVAATYDLVTHSPEGWTFEDKPADLKTVNRDLTQNLTGLLSLTWLF